MNGYLRLRLPRDNSRCRLETNNLDVCDADTSGMGCYHILAQGGNGIFHHSSFVEWPKLVVAETPWFVVHTLHYARTRTQCIDEHIALISIKLSRSIDSR